ncbi:hypothetical protein QOZ80_5BG0414820 [Eleusine coracana subsp. coracana]|nr:hypothetical protein QOZ80_5BG0414820 [Eleusine coracana subsp. coracana]
MADVGSLERMGRELKCPICLSLFKSAVSISCNHNFCNGCLIQSMKSASTCPVCKVPFHRREIHPAPHMDNLVAAFKSMEAAARTSVVSTQDAPAVTIAGGSDCGNSGSKPKRLQKKKVASKKENNRTKATAASASRPTTKPSISTNKRIHVTPFPESETPIRPKKVMKPEEPKNKVNGDVEEDKALTSDKPGSPTLSPFFWLRDEEEGATAETFSEPLSLDTPLRHNAPTFSDIQDSDDENPHNMTPNSKAKVTEIFDSEIFEWSQRPCSPELRSTPVKKQGKFKDILDQITEKDDDEDMQLGGSFDKSDHANETSGDITKESGEMVHYHNGKQVPAEFNEGTNVIHSHKNCLEWAPDVYFEDDSVFNLTTELARSKRIKCACCGIKGAALGCFEMSCRKSFHVTCAKLIPECRWDNENFVMLCPLHQSSKLPVETSGSKKDSKRRLTPKGPFQVKPSQDHGNKWAWPSGLPQKWVLCCSALSAAEKAIVSEFAKMAGVPVSTCWSPSVTHVIASTDQSGACKRTLKSLMAILNGKWIVSIDWVKTCMQCMEPVDEQKFEVNIDVHGTSEGPRLGRCRVINKQPKLFNGMQFYLHGDYTQSYRGYLHDLVITAGGTVLQRKPVSRDQQKLLDDSSMVLIVYSEGNEGNAKSKSKEDINTGHKQAYTQALARASGGKVVSSAWIIDSIAACNLQPL